MDFLNNDVLQTDLRILLQLLIVIVLTGVLGWERESAGKAAGLRTHMLVGIGTVLFVVLGELFITRYRGNDLNMRFDPIRIIEAVITGISFLGAGTIFISRGESDRVSGLTTAASILATAAVGMVVALERYFLAVGSTIIIFFVLRLLSILEFKNYIKGSEKTARRENND